MLNININAHNTLFNALNRPIVLLYRRVSASTLALPIQNDTLACMAHTFETSRPLRQFFTLHLEKWEREERLGLTDLADRCGVSPSYLGQVSRYGRIPGRPVLILLALNFKLKDPAEIFRLANTKDPWPYDRPVRLVSGSEEQPGFLTVRLDMQGLTEAIRDVVKAESRPRTVRELTHGNPLRIGLNRAQDFFFSGPRDTFPPKGFFPELCHLLELGLQTKIETRAVPFSDALELLTSGQIDIYGPMITTPPRLGKAHFTRPFSRIGLSALGRKKRAIGLAPLPAPKSLQELRTKPYIVSVLRDTAAHHFAETSLGADTVLVVSDSPAEALERVTMVGIPRPAHLMLVDATIAVALYQSYRDDLELLFAEPERTLTFFENSIAVRPDWPELQLMLNEALLFMEKAGSLNALLERYVEGGLVGLVKP